MGSHSVSQGIFPTHCRQIIYRLSHQKETPKSRTSRGWNASGGGRGWMGLQQRCGLWREWWWGEGRGDEDDCGSVWMSRCLLAPQASGDRNVLAERMTRYGYWDATGDMPAQYLELDQCSERLVLLLLLPCDSEHLARQSCGYQQAVPSPLHDGLGCEVCWQVSLSLSQPHSHLHLHQLLCFLRVHLCDRVCTYTYTYVYICVHSVCMCTSTLHLRSLHHL